MLPECRKSDPAKWIRSLCPESWRFQHEEGACISASRKAQEVIDLQASTRALQTILGMAQNVTMAIWTSLKALAQRGAVKARRRARGGLDYTCPWPGRQNIASGVILSGSPSRRVPMETASRTISGSSCGVVWEVSHCSLSRTAVRYPPKVCNAGLRSEMVGGRQRAHILMCPNALSLIAGSSWANTWIDPGVSRSKTNPMGDRERI